MKANQDKKIKEQVFNTGFDLKAETFVANLQDDIALNISLGDFFKRRYSSDITAIEKNKDRDKVLDIELSRRNFYNILPERFFHTAYASTPFVPDMVSDYHSRKLEEEDVRKFFSPLEVEFFLNRVSIENVEDVTFRSLGSPELIEFLKDLWRMDENIPPLMAVKILKTMPFMYKIAGNIPLLKLVLENIIEEDILIKKDFGSITEPKNKEPWQLGVNMATSAGLKTYLPKYHFTIYNISRPEQIEAYLPGGSLMATAQFFLEHALPFECDFEIDFTVEEKKKTFVINEAVYSGRLNISATI